MDRLDPRPGQTIVDVGCGTGQTTVELARRVAPGGHVVGVDIAAAMFDRARQHAADAGVTNVEFVHADVQSSPLGQGRFDGAFSRFGVMFFSDPIAAFTNVHASLQPGAPLSFACWHALPANEWMWVPAQAAIAVLGVLPEMPAPDAPGPFSLADPGRIRSVLEGAGFHEIEVVPHEDALVIPESALSDMTESALQVGVVQRMLEGAEADTVDRVRRAIDEELRSRLVDGEVALRRSVLLVRATA
jgi:SAM-dependent methyltransferase